MPQTRHTEKHFTAGQTVRDTVIGMADGLTVPFALAAGLTGAIDSANIIVTAGFAEIPDEEMREVAQVFKSYGLSDKDSAPIVEALSKNPKKWVDFMMRFELGLEKPDPKRALASALTIGGAYAVGGLIPLSPYVIASVFENMTVTTALLISVTLTLLALFVFGFIKGRYTGTRPARSALQTALIGSVAAGAAFLIARLIGG